MRLSLVPEEVTIPCVRFDGVIESAHQVTLCGLTGLERVPYVTLCG